LPPKVEIALPERVLDSYTGVYQFAPQVSLIVTRAQGRMFGQVTGQPRFEIFAERGGEFFVKVVNAQITFKKGANGAVTALALHQNGADQRARKVR
jgi:hypothetical protein